MKITKILIRRGRIYEVRFDDGTYINLDRTYADRLCISEGMTVSEEKANAMEDESDSIRCLNRALYYISQRDLSEKALKQKLLKAGFAERFVSSSVNRLKELYYLSDEDYSVRFARKCHEAGLSKRHTIEKMVQAGFSRETAKEVCDFSSEDEQEKIRHLLNTKYKDKISDTDSIRKTSAALSRRGFAFCDIRAVLGEYDRALGDMTEE